MSSHKQARRWCFTWNNYEEEDILVLQESYPKRFSYCCFGKEVAPTTNMQHLQGYVEFDRPVSMKQVKEALDPGSGKASKVHIDKCIGSQEQNIKYCSKDGDFYEVGIPKKQKNKLCKESPYESIMEAITLTLDMGDVTEMYPEICIKHYSNVEKLVNLEYQRQMKESLLLSYKDCVPKLWQKELLDEVKLPPNSRTVIWYYDKNGNQGKTWLSKWLLLSGAAAYFTNCKYENIAHAYNGERIVIFDFSRCLDGKVGYNAIECVKNGVLFSPKYNSTTKVFKSPWVICMANFKPDYSKLSRDRWVVRTLEDGTSLPTKIDNVNLDLLNAL